MLSAWAATLLFVIWLLVWWRVGRAMGSSGRRNQGAVSGTRLEEASLATLGLLLAFSFSAAASRFEDRRKAEISEATALGDLAGVASVLPEPHQSVLMGWVRGYVALRLESARYVVDSEDHLACLKKVRLEQTRLSQLVAAVISEPKLPPVSMGLVNTMNAVVTAHDTRLAMLRENIPETILGLLAMAAALAMLLYGREQAFEGRAETLQTVSFIVMVSLVLFTIIDLQEPRRGLIRAGSTALSELQRSLSPAQP